MCIPTAIKKNNRILLFNHHLIFIYQIGNAGIIHVTQYISKTLYRSLTVTYVKNVEDKILENKE